MRTIGIVGGLTWRSSQEYYQIINEETARRLGTVHSAKCILYSLDIAEISGFMQRVDAEGITSTLSRAATSLVSAGADFIIIAANTMHKFADEVQTASGADLLSILDATGQAIKTKGLNTVGLLGTKFTMEEDFFKKRLEGQFGIRAFVPGSEERAVVDAAIWDELAQGIVSADTKRRFLRIIDGLAARGAEGIVLGCTEIPLLIREEDLNIPAFDTAKIHALAAVDYALRV